MVTVDTSADISGGSTTTSVDSRATVNRHVGRMSVESRSSINRASIDISTDASVDVPIEVPHKIHDPNCQVLKDAFHNKEICTDWC